jgi:outer membrane protein assembly factor BamB
MDSGQDRNLHYTHVTRYLRNPYPFLILFILLTCISCAPFGGTAQPTSTPTIPPAPTIPYSPPASNALTIAAAGNTLFALQALNGTQRWQYTADGYLNQPVVSNAIAYVASSNGTVYALQANGGSLLWHHSFAVKGFNQTITVNNAIIYFSIAIPGSSGSAGAGKLYALRVSDGTLLWHYQTSTFFTNAPTIDQGSLYINSLDTVYALRAVSGGVLWQHSLQSEGLTTPGAMVEENGIVCVGFGTQDQALLLGLHAKDGSAAWSRTVQDTFINSLIAQNGRIYSISNSQGPGTEGINLTALQEQNGAIAWHQSITGNGTGVQGDLQPSGLLSSPSGFLYVSMTATHAGLVYALAASNGRVLWHYATGGYPTLVSLTGDLLFVQGATYQQSSGGTQTVQPSLYALRIDKGTPLWIKATGKAQPVSKPTGAPSSS